jgi:hypothetical protein
MLSTRSAHAQGASARDLRAEVVVVAQRLAEISGRTIDVRGVVEADAASRDEIVRRRAAAHADPSVLVSCGRAWAEIGLGAGDGPERLVDLIARDIEQVTFDPVTRRLVLDPSLLPTDDFVVDGPDDADAQVLLATGVRPDEPLVAHVLMHTAASGEGEPILSAPTTDELLARAAVFEGEANLGAIRYLFLSMGIGDDVVRLGVDPGEVLEGRLVPEFLGSRAGAVDDLLQFVYRDGFEAIAAAFDEGGSAGVDVLTRGVRGTRDVLHPDRLGDPIDLPDPGPAPEGLQRVCRDRLGEQGVIVLISRGTGKDNLGLIAGDGWAGDLLVRWEAPDAAEVAVTSWSTSWRSETDAEDFAYAYRRVLEVRFPDTIPPETPSDSLRLRSGERSWSIRREGTLVEVRITAGGVDPD